MKEGEVSRKKGEEHSRLWFAQILFPSLNWCSKGSWMMWTVTVAFSNGPCLSLSFLLSIPFFLSAFTKARIPSFSALLSVLSSGSCFQQLSSDNKPLVWLTPFILRYTQPVLNGAMEWNSNRISHSFQRTLNTGLSSPNQVSVAGFFEQSAKEFTIISVTRRRKLYSAVFFSRKALHMFGRITLINHFGWGLSPQSMQVTKGGH